VPAAWSLALPAAVQVAKTDRAVKADPVAKEAKEVSEAVAAEAVNSSVGEEVPEEEDRGPPGVEVVVVGECSAVAVDVWAAKR